jgi:putative ABC transport system permease protein
MLRNYFKIAWRNLLKNKSYSIINIIGLALGIASCIIIMLFVVNELSYDRFNKKADEIVRVVFNAKVNGEEIKEAVVMAPVADALKKEFPEVVEATRLRSMGTPKIVFDNKSYRDGTLAFVDPNFFEVFTLPIVKGDKLTPLNEPNSIVLTQDEAIKYFGTENPIGKILNFKDANQQFKVTAIIDKIPETSHFHFDMLASMLGDDLSKNTSWMESNFYTYLVLKNGIDYKSVEAKLPQIVEKYMGPQIMQALGISFSDFTKKNEIGLRLQPLTEIHLNSDFSVSTTLEQGGDIKYIYIFSAVALFMLLIACINFMNLSTAAAAKKGKEVGVRKVLGSNKKQLIHQFLTESFISTVIAMVVAMVLVILFLPMFNNFSGKDLDIWYLFDIKIMVTLLLLTIVISLLAGAYPAFYLSSFNPITALKNKFSGTGNTKVVRSGLVVFQFIISAGLILATLIVDKQMTFIQNKNIGYNKEQILVLRDAYLLGNNKDAFKNKLLSDPRVEHITTSGYVPAGASDNSMSGVFIGDQGNELRRMTVYNVDEQYIPTLGMEVTAGRNFSKDFGSDSLNVIINETAAKILGFNNDDAVGKTLIRGTDNSGGRQNLTVIGVVKDFNFRSLHQLIDPLIMFNNPYGGLIVKAKVSDMSGLIQSISSSWKSFDVEEPFTYDILDDSFNYTYLAEKKMGDLLRIFALLTIFVACLGLLGLVTFTTEQKFKEIGVRKVLGSSVIQIVIILSKDFIKLVFVSFIIAFPLAFLLMNKWLQDFAYRTEINSQVFVLAALITTCIALLTISFKSIKAATANPIKSLRTE